MKILIKGDVHNNLTELNKEINSAKDIDLVLSVGDVGTYFKNRDVSKTDSTGYKKIIEDGRTVEYINDFIWNIPIYAVPGNHDDQEFLDDRYTDLGIYKVANNFNICHKCTILIDNIWFVFLGKIFVESTLELNPLDIDNIGLNEGRKFTKKDIKKRNHLNRRDIRDIISTISFVLRSKQPNQKIIWISHDAPIHINSVRSYKQGSEYIDQLLNLLSPDRAFFGHYHERVVIDEVSVVLAENDSYILNI